MYGDPTRPGGIAIDDEGYSLVSEQGGNCLSIYDPEGNKIHTVGNLKSPHEDEKKMEKASRTVEQKMAKKLKMHDVKEAT
ncbi:hypothetical protein EMCRGX_G012787 [Ephydatia muelleri]